METCIKCKRELPEGAAYCPACGKKQQPTARKAKSRGNGQGSVYQLPNKTWVAVQTIGYELGEDGKAKRRSRVKKGFKTKKEALNFLPQLALLPPEKKSVTFQALYDSWEPTHRAGKSTMDCYRAAMKYFRPVWFLSIKDIDVDDLQDCLDECPKGKRTKENMKALCGLLYKYAIPRNLATLNMGEYLVVSAGGGTERQGLPIDALEALRKSVGIIPYANYVVAQCYLGFRPSELLALDAANYDRKNKAFTGGAKTDAGKDRVVTVSPKIQGIVDDLTRNKLAGPVFCAQDGKPMSIKAYRAVFYNVLEEAGIENPVEGAGDARRRRYTPHSCRHTFATLMKQVSAPDKDKLQLIGHTSTEMLRHYQDVDIASLRRITDAL